MRAVSQQIRAPRASAAYGRIQAKLADDRTVILDGEPHTVVGVGPPLDEADVGPLAVWVTRPYLRPDASEDLLQRGLSFLRVVGRLPEGRTPEEAQRRLAATIAGYDRLHGGKSGDNAVFVAYDPGVLRHRVSYGPL